MLKWTVSHCARTSRQYVPDSGHALSPHLSPSIPAQASFCPGCLFLRGNYHGGWKKALKNSAILHYTERGHCLKKKIMTPVLLMSRVKIRRIFPPSVVTVTSGGTFRRRTKVQRPAEEEIPKTSHMSADSVTYGANMGHSQDPMMGCAYDYTTGPSRPAHLFHVRNSSRGLVARDEAEVSNLCVTLFQGQGVSAQKRAPAEKVVRV